MTDRMLTVAKPARRNVAGFTDPPDPPESTDPTAEAPAPEDQPEPALSDPEPAAEERPVAARSARRKGAGSAGSSRKASGRKEPKASEASEGGSVQVKCTVPQDVAAALGRHALASGESQTAVFVEAFVSHAETLRREYDPAEAERLEQAGFRPRRRRAAVDGPPRVTVSLYLRVGERDAIDAAAEAAGYSSRSGFVTELLRRQLVSEA